MNAAMDFLFLSDPNVRWVVLGCVAIGIAAGLTGVFVFLRKQALVGDAIAHAILPGVCIGFVLSGAKDPMYLLAGALLSGWLGVWAIEYLQEKTILAPDAAIAIVLSVFFALGLVLLSGIQQRGMAGAGGLDHFLFGKAAAMTLADVKIFSAVAVLIAAFVVVAFKPLKLLAFDADFAQSAGIPVKWIHRTLLTLTVVAVSLGIQAVGVVLMAALLITPAAIARYWTQRVSGMLWVAALSGALAGWFGAGVSWLAPGNPTGPWIVLLLTAFAWVSFIVAPKTGVLGRWWKQYRYQQRVARENLLKSLFKSMETASTWQSIPTGTSPNVSFEESKQSKYAIKQLLDRNLVARKQKEYRLTEKGLAEARRIVRLHRLWELYLSRSVGIADDHVHPTAEALEHILTPEIELQLLQELGHPALDPHQKEIPMS